MQSIMAKCEQSFIYNSHARHFVEKETRGKNAFFEQLTFSLLINPSQTHNTDVVAFMGGKICDSILPIEAFFRDFGIRSNLHLRLEAA